MGWKGTLKSINAAAKRADRAEKKRQRELEALYKHQEKMQEIDRAAYEVEVFNNYLEILQTVHRDCSEVVDWNQVLTLPEPVKPKNSNQLELEAVSLKEKYTPSLIDKIFSRTEKKIKVLDDSIITARNKDHDKHKMELRLWDKDCRDWVVNVERAKNILAGSADAKIAVIKDMNPFDELAGLGSSLHFIVDQGLLHVNVNVFSEDIVPSEHKGLLKSGRLSVKKMPIGKFNEIYQDHVCSVVIRVAREVFAVLPDGAVLINARDKLLNKATGHLEEQNILSVYISRATLNSLNMNAIDPSDCMRNFVHNMNFKKTTGFEVVDTVNISLLR